MNTSSVVLKAAVMPEWRKLFEAGDSDFGGGAWGAIEVCSSNEIGAPNASHLGTGNHASNQPKQTKRRPGKRFCGKFGQRSRLTRRVLPELLPTTDIEYLVDPHFRGSVLKNGLVVTIRRKPISPSYVTCN